MSPTTLLTAEPLIFIFVLLLTVLASLLLTMPRPVDEIPEMNDE